MGISDEELWASVAEGDRIAFGELYERFAELLRLAARSWLDDDLSAEDLTEEILARAWERRAQWRPRRVRSFLLSAVRNLATEHRAAEAARVERERRWCNSISLEPASVERLYELRSVLASLVPAIRSLPAKRRRAFVLVCCHGYSYSAAGDRMRISARTVERHVGIAKAELSGRLSMGR